MRHGTTGSDAKNNPVARQFVQPELNNTELPKRTLDALTGSRRSKGIVSEGGSSSKPALRGR